MPVSRGQKILQADIDALAAAANAKANLEGKPYTFLPRRWIIKTPDVPARNFPPGWPNQGTSGVWDVASLKRLAGLQVGDVVINLKPGKFAFKCAALPTVNPDGSWTGGTWIDLTNDPGFGKSKWYIVNDLAGRDALGAVADGSVCFIINNQPADLSVRGYFVEIRRGGQWRFYNGWATEFNRLRAAVGRRLNAIDPAKSGGYQLKGSAVLGDLFQAGIIFPNVIPNGNLATTAGPPAFKDLSIYYPEGVALEFHRAIGVAISRTPSGGSFQNGFKVNEGGLLTADFISDEFTILDGSGAVVRWDFISANFAGATLNCTISGPLAQYFDAFTANSGPSPKVTFHIHAVLKANAPAAIGAGDQWLSYQIQLNPDQAAGSGYLEFHGLHLQAAASGRVYALRFPDAGTDLLNIHTNSIVNVRKDYDASSDAAAVLHTRKNWRRKKFNGEDPRALPLTGATEVDGGNNYLAGEAIGAVAYYGANLMGQDGDTKFILAWKGQPLGTANDSGDGTEMDAYRVKFARRQFDFVPPAAELIAPGGSALTGQYARTPATQSRGPNLFPNGADLFPPDNHNPSQDNLPRACACKVYPVVFDPLPQAQYVAFSNDQPKGQIVKIAAVRIPAEDDKGQANLPANPPGIIHVDVGCYRNGAFVLLASVTIPAGSNYGVWRREVDDPNGIGILIGEWFPLVVKCDSDVMVYPLWFNANRAFPGLGTGQLVEPSGFQNVNSLFVNAAPPLMPEHYNETIGAVGLVG